MDPIEKAKMLIHTPAPDTGAAHSANLTQITGEAVSDSIDGAVMVNLGGHTVSSDDTQTVEIPCTCDVREGDMVLVQLAGADGSAKGMTVTGVVGGGDRAREKTEEAAKTATNYLSYSETDGLIISEDASTADGWNTQIKSDGLHIRDGETSVADYGDGIKLYTPPDSNGNVTEAVAIDADGININKGKINLSAGESKIDQSCFSSTSADGKTSMYLNNYCVDFFRNETGAATTRIDEPFQEAALDYDGLTLTDNAIQPDDSTYMKDLYITTDHMMYEQGSSQYRINWLDLYKAINLTVKDLTSSVKGNLGGNTTAGNVGSFFSVVKIGKLVICSLNIQMKKNSTSKLAIISGLPKAAYPANGALSYNGYSSSVNVFIRAGEKIIYNDGTIPYDGYVEGQLIYITSE